MDKKCKIHFGDTSDVYGSKITGHKIHFGHPRSKSLKILFGNSFILISPNYHYTSLNANRKWTRLNATPLRGISIMKPSSKEAGLKDIQNYPIIYKGKAN